MGDSNDNLRSPICGEGRTDGTTPVVILMYSLGSSDGRTFPGTCHVLHLCDVSGIMESISSLERFLPFHSNVTNSFNAFIWVFHWRGYCWPSQIPIFVSLCLPLETPVSQEFGFELFGGFFPCLCLHTPSQKNDAVGQKNTYHQYQSLHQQVV